MIEDITESMAQDGYEGKWYSYVDNMTNYRLQFLNGKCTIYKATDTGQVKVDIRLDKDIFNKVRKESDNG